MIEIYNELKYAEEMITKGFLDNKRGQALYILAKYYKIKECKKDSEVKELLVNFCKKHIPDYEYTDYYKTINTCVNNCFSKNNLLLQIDNIIIYNSEVEYICKLNIDNDLKKALFTMLCILRLNQQTVSIDLYNNKIDYGKNGINIKKFGNFQSKVKITTEICHPLYQSGLIDLAYGSTKAKLLFLENINYDSNDNYYTVEDLKNFGFYWEKYILNNEKIIKCVCCGKLVKRNSNRQLMCSDCAENNTKEYQKSYKQQYYKEHYKKLEHLENVK